MHRTTLLTHAAALAIGASLAAGTYAVAAPSAAPDATHRQLLTQIGLLRLDVQSVRSGQDIIFKKLGSPGLPTGDPYSVGGQLDRLRSTVDAIYSRVSTR